MTTQELMEASNETVQVWASMIDEELRRRRLYLEAMPVHDGNVDRNGKPIPLLVRIMKKAATLPPADLAKVEMLMNGLRP